ncbi:MAG TPA: extracellular solute-binding protein [Bacillota bacterium]|nr:extracellular solute-binding protein [Bacillota bacterium]
MNFLNAKSKWYVRLVWMVLLFGLAASAVIAKQPVTRITIWTINQPGVDPVGNWIEQKIRQFEKVNPGIRVEHRFWENQSYKTKLKVAMFSGEGPDIFFNWGGESQFIYARAGLLYDLTHDLGKNKWGLSQKMFTPHSYRGKVYGVPIFPTVSVVWYNKELFVKHGWRIPLTWQEFLALCHQIKAKGYIPVAMGGQEPWTILHPYMYIVNRIAGTKRYFSAKNRQIPFTHPDFVKALQILQELAHKGCFPTEVLSLNYMDANQLMVHDKALMMISGDWEYARLTNQLRQDLNKWDFFSFPVFPGEKGDFSSIIGAMDGFSIKRSNHAKAAVKFLKYLSGKANLVEIYRKSGNMVALATPYIGAHDPPQFKKIAKLLANAPLATQWWDQDLPEPVSQVLLRSLQDLVADKCTPKQAAVRIEQAYIKH